MSMEKAGDTGDEYCGRPCTLGDKEVLADFRYPQCSKKNT